MRVRVFLAVVVAALGCVLAVSVMRWRGVARVDAPVVAVAPEVKASVTPGAPEKQWVLMKVVTPAWRERQRSEVFAWNDARVRAWVEKNATVVTVDVATDAETQRALALENAPALLAFKGCKEFDRIPLHQSPRGLLEWFAGLERGERSAEMVVGPEPHLEDAALKRAMVEHWAAAQRWVLAGENAKATEAYVWLWPRMEILFYCRPAQFERDVTELVNESKEARTAFADVRDAVLERLRADKVPCRDVLEFVQLNRILEEDESTFAWYEVARREKRRMPLIRLASEEILNVLRYQKRWREACEVMGDPMFEIEQCRQLEDELASQPNPNLNTPREMQNAKSSRNSRLGLMYISLLGAGREVEARELGERVRAEFHDPDLTMAMVVCATIGLDSPRPEHLGWMESDLPESKSNWLRKWVQDKLMKRLMAMPWC